MTRAQATALVWFIKFTIKFMAPSHRSNIIGPDAYTREEQRIITLLSEEKA